MRADQQIWFSISTPGGLIVRLDFDSAPKPLQDIFRRVEDTTRMQDEKAVAYLSRLTQCRCTINRSSQVTCEANSQVGLKET